MNEDERLRIQAEQIEAMFRERRRESEMAQLAMRQDYERAQLERQADMLRDQIRAYERERRMYEMPDPIQISREQWETLNAEIKRAQIQRRAEQEKHFEDDLFEI